RTALHRRRRRHQTNARHRSLLPICGAAVARRPGRRSLTLTRRPFATFTLCATIAAFALVAPYSSAVFDALVLDREAVQPWAWLTAPVVHTDWSRVGWNLFALACLGALAEPIDRARFVASIVVGVAAVDGWFAWIDDSLRFYCGLSGSLNTVLLATLYALRGTIAPPWLFGVAAIAGGEGAWGGHKGVAVPAPPPLARARGAPRAGVRRGL